MNLKLRRTDVEPPAKVREREEALRGLEDVVTECLAFAEFSHGS